MSTPVILEHIKKMSDVLQMPLTVDRNQLNVGAVSLPISGALTVQMESLPGEVDLEFTLMVKASSILGSQLWMLVHVGVDLFLLVVHSKATDRQSVLVLDGAKIRDSDAVFPEGGMFLSGHRDITNRSLADIYRNIIWKVPQCLLAHYEYIKKKWKRIDDAHSVDPGYAAPPEEGGGPSVEWDQHST
jgi:hypothetical protein